jgi:hypothetical protein
MRNWMTDIKMYLLNVGTLALSFSEIDMVLKILLLIISIGYTFHKWILMHRKSNEKNK